MLPCVGGLQHAARFRRWREWGRSGYSKLRPPTPRKPEGARRMVRAKERCRRENRFHWPSDWRNVSDFVARKLYFVAIFSLQIKFLILQHYQTYFPESLCQWTTTGAGVRSQVGFVVDIDSNTGTGYSPCTSVFPRRYHSTSATYSHFTRLPSLLCNLNNWHSSEGKQSSVSVSFCHNHLQ